jgi:hypothetical protein
MEAAGKLPLAAAGKLPLGAAAGKLPLVARCDDDNGNPRHSEISYVMPSVV